MDAFGPLIAFGFLALFLGLIALAAHFISKAVYGHLVREGYGYANAIRVVSFIAIFIGMCMLGFICLMFTFQR